MDITTVTYFLYKIFKHIEWVFNKYAPIGRIKKINFTSLPPCVKTLQNHSYRAHYIARPWSRVWHIDTIKEVSPSGSWWKLDHETVMNCTGFQAKSFLESVSCPLTNEVNFSMEKPQQISHWSLERGNSDSGKICEAMRVIISSLSQIVHRTDKQTQTHWRHT